MTEDKSDAQWRIDRSTYLIDSPFLRLRKDSITLPGGKQIEDYFVRETRGFAVIFARTPDGRVVLIREYKHGIGERVTVLPAGAIDPGESALDCAMRELREETGYTAPPERFELVATLISDAANSDGRFHLYFVDGAEPTTTQDLDVSEQIEVLTVPLRDLRPMMRRGDIDVGHIVASLYTVLEHLELLGS